jgi:hypothetical protein
MDGTTHGKENRTGLIGGDGSVGGRSATIVECMPLRGVSFACWRCAGATVRKSNQQAIAVN